MTDESGTVQDDLPQNISDLPPSARFVYRELQRAGGEITIDTLVSKTGYSTRTIRHATNILDEEGVIRSEWRDDDPRVRVFKQADAP